MQMQIISSENSQAQSIVVAALVRSFTPSIFDTTTDESVAAVWLNPREMEIPQVQALLVRGGKVLALGCPDVGAAGFLGLSAENLPTNSSQWSDCPVCTGDPTESPVLVTYAEKGLGAWAGLAQRALCRFDFQNEWNTLGFGRISGGSGSPWSLACLVREGEAEPVAVLRRREDGIPLSWYAALREVGGGAILWYNRLVGPVDSVEWRLVERFFSDYRKDTLRCLPCLEELPFGCPGMVMPRLDCDEAVATARPVFELYRSRGIPFTLAVKTGQLIAETEKELLMDVVTSGGAVLAHSRTHLINWGKDPSEAFSEAIGSKNDIINLLPEGYSCNNAVSPFHTNRPWTFDVLNKANFTGVISGIIHNDPEFLLARGGIPPFTDGSVVTHSQQCMLHGDCPPSQVGVVHAQFLMRSGAAQAFGYLDHPFSPRYSYGWATEEARITIHKQVIDDINSTKGIWWVNGDALLSHIACLSRTRIQLDVNETPRVSCAGEQPTWPLCVRYRGQLHKIMLAA